MRMLPIKTSTFFYPVPVFKLVKIIYNLLYVQIYKLKWERRSRRHGRGMVVMALRRKAFSRWSAPHELCVSSQWCQKEPNKWDRWRKWVWPLCPSVLWLNYYISSVTKLETTTSDRKQLDRETGAQTTPVSGCVCTCVRAAYVCLLSFSVCK